MKKEIALEKFSEVEYFDQLYQSKEDTSYFKVNEGIPQRTMKINGEEFINFSSYNYLGLNGSKIVNRAAIEAINKYGTSVSASRLVSGEIELHQLLENKIASFLGVEASIVQVGGYSTNVNTIGNIVNTDDLILLDSYAHSSIVQGAQLSHARVKSFKHNNMEHLEKRLARLRDRYRRTLIVVEGVYSMDGDICNLPELIRLKKEYGAILMIDEAHSLGTIGKNGRGVTSYDIDILMGTLSKSVNSCGGYIAGSKKFINYLRYNSPGFIFSVGMTPANTAAALASIQMFDENNDLFELLRWNSDYFLNGLRRMGINTGLSKDTPVIPLITGDSEKADEISAKLLDSKINALPIIFPAVKEEEARIRFFISASHTQQDLDYVLNVISKIMEGKND